MEKSKRTLAILAVVALGASIFSISATQTLAQSNTQGGNSNMDRPNDDMNMMQMQQNQDMQHANSMNVSGGTMMNGMSVFSTNGMSLVDGVKITGISITGNNEISANLKYTGNGTSPRVTVVAMTTEMMGGGMMNMMMSMNGGSSGMMMDEDGQNMTMQDDSAATSMMSSMHNNMKSGSNVLDSGWKSPTSVTIKLQDSNTTSEDTDYVMVMVFPFVEGQ